MQNDKIILPLDIYTSYLKTIRGVEFTPREIEIIACLLNGRSTKTIPSFLSISPKTVATHISNIRGKAGCSSRESVIDFIESSDKYPLIKHHYYSSLVTRISFEKYLKASSIRLSSKPSICTLVDTQEQNDNPFLIHYLESHLKLAGITVKSKDKEDLSSTREEYNIYVGPSIPQTSLSQNNNIFLMTEKHAPQKYVSIEYIDFSNQANYYLSFLKLLKTLYPDHKFEDFILHKGMTFEPPQQQLAKPTQVSSFIKTAKQLIELPFKSPSPLWRFCAVGLIGLGIGTAYIFSSNYIGSEKAYKNNPGFSKNSIRSDLVIPVQDAFLERSELITQLDEKFKGKNGIQTIALIGLGGAGKTTLARQYAHLQKANVIWEINAETQESLSSSFESLAQALAKTEEDKKILMQIRNLQIPSEKEDKIILFVKERLRKQDHWFLVFDNVDSFIDIQKYFPHDAETWGQGKIILTTRDSTLQSNKSVNNAIQIGELTPQQKLVLFTKVIKQGNENIPKIHQVEETKKFLEKIPPYPLDVSVAAYYIKSTDTPYAAYLESLNSYHKEFITIQEWLLKENGDYLKTRYGIVSLSLQNLISTHKNFAELLLFVSVLDSQNIPIDLLKKYKGDHATDNFIYHLKKYSLITNNSQVTPRLIPTISIHRSTQAMVLAYLEKNLTLKKTQALVQEIVETLVSYADTALEEQNIIMVKLLLNHYDRFLTYDNLLTESSKNAIRRELAYMYFGFGDFIKTKDHLESGLMNLKEGYLKGDVMVARPLSYLGETYRGLGSSEKSKDVLENSLMLCKQHPTHQKELGRTLVYLGNTYRDLGNYNKAIEFLSQALAVLKQDLPKNNSAYAEALAYMGLAYWFSGDYVNHRYYLEKSVDLYKNYFPENQLLIGATSSHLANSYAELGFDEKARDLLEKSLDVLRSCNKTQEHGYALLLLGNVYRKLGNYQKAKPLIEEALITLKQVHPDNQVRLVEAFTYLGVLNGEIVDYKTAKDLLNQSLIVYENKYGREHTQYGKILWRLGEVYFREGDLNQAEDLLQKSLAILKKNKHTDAYLVLESLADLYLKKSKLGADKGSTQQSEGFKNQANTYLKQSLQIVHTHFPKDSPHIIRIQNKLKSLDEN